jgi:predicted small lipoprotein YifL
LLLALLIAAGCGQKGPLYLPGNPSEIKTDVPRQDESQTEEDEEDEDEDEQLQDSN